MSAAVIPAHVAEINGKPLRFFGSADDRPELPRHSLDDLMVVCGFDRGDRRHFMRATQKAYGHCLRVVTTWTGPVTTAPHFVAQGLIGAAVDVGRTGNDTYEKYTRAGIDALNAITKGVPHEAQGDWLMSAIKNS
ncbi:hypothetical protein, partial [Beijerinckia sp. L45]|uniref:hypothetical protein n=1 Tax=Beijerinckia sp. L45 TaxID=1641855 RepID=UPI00131BDF06